MFRESSEHRISGSGPSVSEKNIPCLPGRRYGLKNHVRGGTKVVKGNGSASQFEHCCAGVANPGGNPSDRHALRILSLIACLRDGEIFFSHRKAGAWNSGPLVFTSTGDGSSHHLAGLTAATSHSDQFSPAHCLGHRAGYLSVTLSHSLMLTVIDVDIRDFGRGIRLYYIIICHIMIREAQSSKRV